MSESTMRCAMTGIVLHEPSDGIWDDGEWISWHYINQQLAELEGNENDDDDDPRSYGRPWHKEDMIGGGPDDDLEDWETDDGLPVEEFDPELLQEMVALHLEDQITEKTSPRWGEIGESYVSRHHGVKLSRAHAQGHDGHLGSDVVEIKTISPSKRVPFVRVKRAGNFNVLAVVRILPNLQVAVRFIRRAKLPPGDGGRYYFVNWNMATRLGDARHPKR